ncbi:hypothetical protein H8D36_06690 [archaeon]|nr:hypothetical protein [archaeon]
MNRDYVPRGLVRHLAVGAIGACLLSGCGNNNGNMSEKLEKNITKLEQSFEFTKPGENKLSPKKLTSQKPIYLRDMGKIIESYEEKDRIQLEDEYLSATMKQVEKRLANGEDVLRSLPPSRISEIFEKQNFGEYSNYPSRKLMGNTIINLADRVQTFWRDISNNERNLNGIIACKNDCLQEHFDVYLKKLLNLTGTINTRDNVYDAFFMIYKIGNSGDFGESEYIGIELFTDKKFQDFLETCEVGVGRDIRGKVKPLFESEWEEERGVYRKSFVTQYFNYKSAKGDHTDPGLYLSLKTECSRIYMGVGILEDRDLLQIKKSNPRKEEYPELVKDLNHKLYNSKPFDNSQD